MSYFPILRFKRGEQIALSEITDNVKQRIHPLLVISPHEYDPPDEENVDSAFDARISTDAKRFATTWGNSEASVDFNDIDSDARCNGVVHPLKHFYSEIPTKENLNLPHPVVRISSTQDYLDAVIDVCSEYDVLPTFRVFPGELLDIDSPEWFSEVAEQCGTSLDHCIAVIDLSFIEEASQAAITALGALGSLPALADWRVIAVAAGSMPRSLSTYAVGVHRIHRHEWDMWRKVRSKADREITYGDYATVHPLPAVDDLNPAIMNPSASVRYTRDNQWLLLRGQGLKSAGSGGFAQFKNHADQLVQLPEYRGQAFSSGDNRIWDIHQANSGTGNLTTWITIAVNHHLSELDDLIANTP